VWAKVIGLVQQQEPPEYDYGLMEAGWDDCQVAITNALQAAALAQPAEQPEGETK